MKIVTRVQELPKPGDQDLVVPIPKESANLSHRTYQQDGKQMLAVTWIELDPDELAEARAQQQRVALGLAPPQGGMQ